MPMASSNRPARGGFSLTEILVALAVGMVLLNAAFALLVFTQRFIQRIEKSSIRNEVVNDQILWAMRGSVSQYPEGVFTKMTGGYMRTVSSGAMIQVAARTYSKITPSYQLQYGVALYIPVVN